MVSLCRSSESQSPKFFGGVNFFVYGARLRSATGALVAGELFRGRESPD